MKKLLLAFVLMAAGVSALTLQFTGPDYQEGCQCDPQSFSLALENPGAEGEAFTLSMQISSPAMFTTFVTPRVEATSHSTNEVLAFLTPHCDALPGEYSFIIKATGSRGTVLTAEGRSKINQCHYLQLQLSNEQAVCPGDEAAYSVKLTNAGIFEEHGDVATDFNSRYYNLANRSFSLLPGQTKEFMLYLNMPASTPPQEIPFKVNASSQYTYRDSYSKIVLKQCSGLEVLLPPSCIEVQPGEAVTATVEFRNTAERDSFDIEKLGSAWVTLSGFRINDLGAGASTTMTLSINAPQSELGKNFPLTVRATSVRYNTRYQNSTEICVRQMYSAKIDAQVAGDQVNVCKGDSAAIGYTMTNTGKKAATWALSTSMGTISKTQTTLPVAASDTFNVAVDTSPLSFDSYEVVVKGTNQFYVAEKRVKLVVENCYDSGLGATGGQLEMCPSEYATASLNMQNRGTRQDTFALSATTDLQAEVSPLSLTIAAGATQPVSLKVTVPYTTPYDTQHAVTVTAVGASTSSATVGVRVLPLSACHSVSVSSDADEKKIEVCKGDVFEITLTNRGRFTENLVLSTEGPTWAFATPNQVSLKPGESKKAYVYFAPPFNTAQGKYQITFKAASEYASATKTLTADVYPVGGLGEQVPNYNSADYSINFENLNDVMMEYGVSQPVTIVVSNPGIADIHNILLFFQSDLFEINNASIKPFDLKAGAKESVTVMLKPKKTGTFPTEVRLVSKEKHIEKVVDVHVTEPTLVFEEVGQRISPKNASLLEMTFKATNKGAPISVTPSLTLENAAIEPVSFPLGTNETKTFTATVEMPKEANKAYRFGVATERGIYSLETKASPMTPAALSGMFASLPSLGMIVIVLVGCGLAVFLMLRRKPEADEEEAETKRGEKKETRAEKIKKAVSAKKTKRRRR